MAKVYPQQEIEKGLQLAAAIGIRPAARELDLPYSTLQEWTQEHAERYAEIKTQEAPKWRARAAAATEEIVDTLTDLERAAIDKLSLDLHALDAKDVPNALKAITVAKGINADHVAKYRGQPTVQVEHTVNMPQIDKALDLLLNRGSVESTALEAEDPPLLESPEG